MVKNLPANVGDAGDLVRSLDQEDSLEDEMATHSSLLAWRIPMDRGVWRAAVQGFAELDTTEYICTHFQNYSDAGYRTGGNYRCVRG